MRALILRPEPQAGAMAAALAAHGIDAAVMPMLAVEPIPGAAAAIAARAETVQALVVTSAAAVAALTAEHAVAALSAVPVVAVGPATAAACRAAGFSVVIDAAGDADAAMAAVAARFDPSGGAIVHAAGRDRAADVTGTLAAAGYSAETVTVYHADAAGPADAGVAADLRAGGFDAVIVASARTATAFERWLEQASVSVPVPGATLVAISAKAAAPLRPFFRRLVLAAAPDGESLTKAVVALAAAAANNRGGDRTDPA